MVKPALEKGSSATCNQLWDNFFASAKVSLMDLCLATQDLKEGTLREFFIGGWQSRLKSENRECVAESENTFRCDNAWQAFRNRNPGMFNHGTFAVGRDPVTVENLLQYTFDHGWRAADPLDTPL
jgi:hypothetical protein